MTQKQTKKIEQCIDLAGHHLNKNIGRLSTIVYDGCIHIPLLNDYDGFILEVEYDNCKPVSVSLLRESDGFFDDFIKIIIKEDRNLYDYIENILIIE